MMALLDRCMSTRCSFLLVWFSGLNGLGLVMALVGMRVWHSDDCFWDLLLLRAGSSSWSRVF